MLGHRQRAVVLGLAAFAAVWALALAGYFLFGSTKVTAGKVSAYLREVEFEKLSGEERRRALRELAGKLNALPYEERQRARLQREWQPWFEAMTEEERGEFIEATLPEGFKQMLTAFEQMPPERRRQAIDRATRELDKARQAVENGETEAAGWRGRTNPPPELSPELRACLVQIGLKSFYNESSAQTRAELAPLLEGMQRLMESGAFFRHRHP